MQSLFSVHGLAITPPAALVSTEARAVSPLT